MKKRLLIIQILIFIGSNNIFGQVKGNFIKFGHVGLSFTTKYIRPLILCTKNTVYNLNQREKEEVREVQTSIKSFTEKGFIEDNYHFIFTNDTTLKLVQKFVLNHNEFFVNDVNFNNEEGSNSCVFMYGKSYEIFYKVNTQFFSDLSKYLASTKCDSVVVKAVANYVY